MDDQITQWRHFADEAAAGRLYLNDGVAERCRDACNRQIDLLDALRSDLDYVTRVQGMGDFACADALSAMLSAKARGGERDVDTALREHIEVLTLIRDTIEVSVNRQVAQDEASRTDIQGAG